MRSRKNYGVDVGLRTNIVIGRNIHVSTCMTFDSGSQPIYDLFLRDVLVNRMVLFADVLGLHQVYTTSLYYTPARTSEVEYG